MMKALICKEFAAVENAVVFGIVADFAAVSVVAVAGVETAGTEVSAGATLIPG